MDSHRRPPETTGARPADRCAETPAGTRSHLLGARRSTRTAGMLNEPGKVGLGNLMLFGEDMTLSASGRRGKRPGEPQQIAEHSARQGVASCSIEEAVLAEHELAAPERDHFDVAVPDHGGRLAPRLRVAERA